MCVMSFRVCKLLSHLGGRPLALIMPILKSVPPHNKTTLRFVVAHSLNAHTSRYIVVRTSV